MSNFRLPVLGWTFAEDFLTSKTTHFAFTVIVAAVTGFEKGQLTLFQALSLGVGSTLVALLRDAHAKWLQTIGTDLFDVLAAARLPVENPDGGEVPDSLKAAPLAPAPFTEPGAVDYQQVAAEVAKLLRIPVQNPMADAISAPETPKAAS